MNTPDPDLIAGLAELAPLYRHLLCDVWGVVHDGVSAFPAAGEALARFRAGGGHVVLITNAPVPRHVVLQQLDRLGVDRAAYDDVVSSGEASRSFMSGSSECPPASSLASSPCSATAASAASTESART